MSDILRTIDHMRTRGVAAEAILEAVYALEAARADKLEQRREADRGRQRRHRLNKRLETEDIVSRDTSTVTAGSLPGGSPFPEPLSSPNPSESLSVFSARTREDRLQAQRDLQQNHWQEIREACTKRANGALAATPSVMDISPIIRLMAPLEGEPCDLQLDILPAIDWKAAQAHQTHKPIKAWSWINERAIANRDQRLTPLPTVEQSNGRPDNASGGGRSFTPRGQAEDPIDRMRARMARREADPDIIEHTPVAQRA